MYTTTIMKGRSHQLLHSPSFLVLKIECEKKIVENVYGDDAFDDFVQKIYIFSPLPLSFYLPQSQPVKFHAKSNAQACTKTRRQTCTHTQPTPDPYLSTDLIDLFRTTIDVDPS